MNNYAKKLSTTIKVIDRVTLFAIAIVIFVLLLWLISLCIPELRESALDNMVNTLDYGDVEFEFYNEALLPDGQVLNYRLISCFGIGFFSIIAFLASCFIIRNTIKSLKKDTVSFSLQLSKGFRRLAVLVLVLSIVSFIADICNYYFFEAYDLQYYLSDYEQIGNGSTLLISAHHNGISIPLDSIVGTSFLFLISILFKHGEVLQKESDETL